jgi:single-strand DNA-binding protein
MKRINHVILSGNVVKDTEVRYTKEGKPITTISFAVNNDYKSKITNEWVKQPCFIEVIIWKAAQYVKGAPLIVVGKLSMRQWESDDGQKRQKLEIQADSVVEIIKEKADSVKEEAKNEEPF